MIPNKFNIPIYPDSVTFINGICWTVNSICYDEIDNFIAKFRIKNDKYFGICLDKSLK